MNQSPKVILSIGLLVCLLCIGGTAGAASVTLTWNANSESDLNGYNIYYGNKSRSYNPPIPVGKVTSYTVDNLISGGIYFFSVTAVDTSGNESGYSSEIQGTASSSSQTSPTPNNFSLMLSSSASRSGAASLQGSTTAGKAYIFLTPETNVKNVDFSLDGSAKASERYAPFDLMGGEPSAASPLDTTSLADGSHEVVAKVTLGDGSTSTVKATFTVANQTVAEPAPTPNNFSLMLSSSASRSGAASLQGSTTAGKAYIFLTPETNVKNVDFSLDGSAKASERYAPFDLMGGEPSAASPLDTTSLADGSHEVVAKVTLGDGSTSTVKATFTVAN